MSDSEATAVVPPTTEDTPAETPAATTDETTPAETPAATTEETPAPADAPADDQPAVTEVTEVTPTTEDAPKEEASKADIEEAPKEKEAPKEEKKKEGKFPCFIRTHQSNRLSTVKKKQPKAAKVVDYRTSKAGWVQRRGLLFKKWQPLYMCLDEEESVLRWWKRENKTSGDGALFMKYVGRYCLCIYSGTCAVLLFCCVTFTRLQIW